MTTTKTLAITAATSIFALIATQPSAQAYRLFFGEDLNNSWSTPLSATPNSSAAQGEFLSGLVGVGVETFEGFSAGTRGPVGLNFGEAGVATLQGNGYIQQRASGTSAAGRYAVSGSKFWEGAAGSGAFSIDFSQEVAAFGFNGVDIGDFGGQLSLILDLVNGGQTTVTVPNTVGRSGSTDGSVLYFGLIAENDDELFNGLSFSMTTGQGDMFAFDNMTIGSKEQVASTPEPVSVLGLLAVGAMGAVAGLKRKAN